MAQPSFDATAYGIANPAATSVTWSHTVGAGSNRALVVVGWNNNSSDLTPTCTAGGVSMTLVGMQHGLSSYCCIFVLAAPTSGSISIVLSDSAGGNADWIGMSMSFTTVNQTTPYANFNSASGTSQPSSVTITNTSNDTVVDGIGGFSTGDTLAADGSQTQEQSHQDDQPNFNAGCSYFQGTGTAKAMKWTCLNTTSTWRAVGCILQGTGAGETITVDKWHPEIQRPYLEANQVVGY